MPGEWSGSTRGETDPGDLVGTTTVVTEPEVPGATRGTDVTPGETTHTCPLIASLHATCPSGR